MEYHATKEGHIFSTRKQLKSTKHHTGYMVVTIYTKKKAKQERVHRFIWEYFNGKIPIDKMIDHIDGDKTNNCLTNLRLASAKQNIDYARSMRGNWNNVGQSVYNSKITDALFFEMVNDFVMGMSNDKIGEKYGLHPRYVSLIRHKRRWQHLWKLCSNDIIIPSGILNKRKAA